MSFSDEPRYISSSRPGKQIILNGALLAGTLLIALILAELIARAASPLSTVEYRIDKKVGQILAPEQRARWVSRDYDVMVVTNNAGFHDVAHTKDKPSNLYRIVVLGDSFIEALQVPIGDGFTQQLQALVQDWVVEKKVEVVNLGISGTSPSQHYRLLEVVGFEYEPDLIVCSVFPDNDFRDSHRELSGATTKPYYFVDEKDSLVYVPPNPPQVGVLYRWLRKSAVLHLVRRAIAASAFERVLARVGLVAPESGVAQEDMGASIPVDWYVFVGDAPQPWPEAYALTLRMIKELYKSARARGAEFLVMAIGSVPTVENRWKEIVSTRAGASALSWDFERPYKDIQALGEKEGFEVVNLIEPFRNHFRRTGSSLSWEHDGHWNAEGHRLAAETVSKYLKRESTEYGLK